MNSRRVVAIGAVALLLNQDASQAVQLRSAARSELMQHHRIHKKDENEQKKPEE